MNYFKQLNEFYSTLDYKPLTAEAISIYFILLQIANNTGWIDQFQVANTILTSKCNISIDQLKRARNNLINKGYIKYKSGKNQHEMPSYSIIQLYLTQAPTQAEAQADTQAPTQATAHNNKQNKTKINNIFKPPSLEDVKNYVLEKKLNVDAEKFYDYFTAGNWIDSNGKKVKNWKQKILTWNSYAKNKSFNEVSQKPAEQEQYTAVDISSLTQEEYGKLMRKEITIEELIKEGKIDVE